MNGHPHVCHLSHYFSKEAGPKRFYFLCHKKLWFPTTSLKTHSLKTKGSWIVMHMNFKMNPRKLGQKIQHCGHNTASQLHKLLKPQRFEILFEGAFINLLCFHEIFHTFIVRLCLDCLWYENVGKNRLQFSFRKDFIPLP